MSAGVHRRRLMLQDEFERLLAGKDDVKLLVKVRG